MTITFEFETNSLRCSLAIRFSVLIFPFGAFNKICIMETQTSNVESKHLFKIGWHPISIRQFDESGKRPIKIESVESWTVGTPDHSTYLCRNAKLFENRWKIVSGDHIFTDHAKNILDGSET